MTDGGYFDGNSREGRVSDHVDFLVSMSEVYQRRWLVMTEDERSKTGDAIDRRSGLGSVTDLDDRGAAI